MIERILSKSIKSDLDQKIVLLSGPRQVGKTTLSQALFGQCQYLNYDRSEHARIIVDQAWVRDGDLVILDELHKLKNWKQLIKGVFDVEGVRPRIMVTGSARLETLTNVGDSLAGRFFAYRLHPLGLKELRAVGYDASDREILDRLLRFGGFPEPFLNNNPRFYRRWEKSHLDVILREDFLGLMNVKDISQLRILIELLRERVGSPCSFSSLAEDLAVSYKTVQSWVALLERLYIIFRVTPYSKNIARSILKVPKFYFYNTALVKGNEGVRFENLVATSLLKECHYLHDVEGYSANLYYLRNKNGHEIDFLGQAEDHFTMVEVKQKKADISKHFKVFSQSFDSVSKVQVVNRLSTERSDRDGVQVKSAENWLKSFSLLKPM